MKTDDIELKGEMIEGFERVEKIVSIILLGEKGGIRKIDIHSQQEKVNGKVLPYPPSTADTQSQIKKEVDEDYPETNNDTIVKNGGKGK